MMTKKITISFLVSILLLQFSAKAQFDFSKIEYWIGNGNDSCALVLDFHDGTSDTCYVWGILMNDSIDGETMLNIVAAADINFAVTIGGGFLSDITYGSHIGIGGTPNYWMTYTGTDISNLVMNMGISSVIKHKEIFGGNYSPVDATYNPIFPIGKPIPAFDPLAFTISDVTYFVGSGTDTAIMIIDFQTGNDVFAWGYVFSDSTTGEEMLNALIVDDANLSAVMSGGFLTDINYYNHTGLGGNPNYWGTWSATNLGNWTMNMGMSTKVVGGDFFGCSYTDFMPALRPNTPVAAPNTTSIVNLESTIAVSSYPNPTSDVLNIKSDVEMVRVVLLNANGSIVIDQQIQANYKQINLNELSTGMYFLQIQVDGQMLTKKVVKN